MYDADYWRVKAARFRKPAYQTEDPAPQELMDLRVVCKELAQKIEACAPSG